MRVLFSSAATYGHFLPLVPLARAFADDGHEVAFATSASFGERVEDAGFELLPAGADHRELHARFAPLHARLQTMPVPDRRPLSFTWRFATIEAPSRLVPLRDTARAYRPDLLVHGSADLAAPIVAASLGLPRANHSFGRVVPVEILERAAAESEPLWAELGVQPEPLCGAFTATYVDICPPSLQSTSLPPGTRVEPVRPLSPVTADEPPPDWIDGLPDQPMVYVTLGTLHGDVSTYRGLLDALADLDVNVVMTVGRGNDPAPLAPLPANAVVERFVPQSFILPRASVVVTHGGSGSILGALAEGLPMVLVPQGADQFENAARCAELGAGLVLMPGEVTSRSVREAVETVLAEPAHRASARAMAEEIAAMPHPREAAARLAASAAGRL